MRLFHVSEDNDIKVFAPRMPAQDNLDKSKPLVWAITEECLPNYLTPRDCPRVTYHVGNKTLIYDIEKYMSSDDCMHVVAIENKWFNAIKNTTLYLYEFDQKNLYLQDEIAGYYVSDKVETPINKYVITDLFDELFRRNIEVRILDNLWDLCNKIKTTTFNWSMCKMGNAQIK